MMKTIKILIFLLAVYVTSYSQVIEPNPTQATSLLPGAKSEMLPNGWTLTPTGKSLELGDLPLNIAVSSSKKLMAVTNNGQGTQSIQLIDAVDEKVLDKVEIPKSFYGLA